ncbi:MAG TPA: LysR substrate-binding domain-containing protein, partial [Roseateles sp.]|nr:LysR substrate-binding domain-containing protein [Roseateles sp.]HWT54751.1 LysR substrate-binding domain-containing protein [Rhodocyclaceae bacterium]
CKLEGQVEQTLFAKAGRKLALTEAGELLLGYARRMLELNDEAVARVRSTAIEGWVRVGLPHDFAEHGLPAALARFAKTHDKVRIEARAERNTELIKRVAAGQLDLALVWQDERVPRYLEKVAELPLTWIGQPGYVRSARTVLPLAAFEAPCMFRAAATAALDKVGQPWHLSFTTPSLAGLWAAVESGLGLAVRTPIGVPRHLALLGKTEKLPPLPSVSLVFIGAPDAQTPAVSLLQEILRETVIGVVESALATRPLVRRRR